MQFLQRFVTMNETWVLHFQPETKQQSKQWKHLGSPSSNEAKTVTSVVKVIASIFCGRSLLVDYLDKSYTVTEAYYADLLRQLREKTKQIRRGKLTRGGLFHQDNVLAHTFTVDSNLSKTHHILLIWFPLTTISSQK